MKSLVQSKKEEQRTGIDTIKYQGYQWESDKLTVKHYKREPSGQPFFIR